MMLILNGENRGVEISKEMDSTMGLMMSGMHAEGTTLKDLLSTEWLNQEQQTGGHHSLPWFLKSIDRLGSSLILMLLPLMIGASALMITLWI